MNRRARRWQMHRARRRTGRGYRFRGTIFQRNKRNYCGTGLVVDELERKIAAAQVLAARAVRTSDITGQTVLLKEEIARRVLIEKALRKRDEQMALLLQLHFQYSLQNMLHFEMTQ